MTRRIAVSAVGLLSLFAVAGHAGPMAGAPAAGSDDAAPGRKVIVPPVPAEAAPRPSPRLDAPKQKELPQIIARYFEGNVGRRLYLQVDKPLYRPGESIWFKAWDMKARALAGTDNAETNVELISPKGAVVLKKRVHAEAGSAANDFDLPAEAQGGEYTLRATTGDGHKAERGVIVAAYEPPRIKKKLEFVKKAYGAGDQVSATVEVQASDRRSARRQAAHRRGHGRRQGAAAGEGHDQRGGRRARQVRSAEDAGSRRRPAHDPGRGRRRHRVDLEVDPDRAEEARARVLSRGRKDGRGPADAPLLRGEEHARQAGRRRRPAGGRPRQRGRHVRHLQERPRPRRFHARHRAHATRPRSRGPSPSRSATRCRSPRTRAACCAPTTISTASEKALRIGRALQREAEGAGRRDGARERARRGRDRGRQRRAGGDLPRRIRRRDAARGRGRPHHRVRPRPESAGRASRRSAIAARASTSRSSRPQDVHAARPGGARRSPRAMPRASRFRRSSRCRWSTTRSSRSPTTRAATCCRSCCSSPSCRARSRSPTSISI